VGRSNENVNTEGIADNIDIQYRKVKNMLGLKRGIVELYEKAQVWSFLGKPVTVATKDADAVRKFYTRNGYGTWTTMFFKRTGLSCRDNRDFEYTR